MSMRLYMAARVVGLLGSGLLAGCGGGSASDNASAASTTVNTTAPTVPSVSIGPANIDPVPAAVQLASGATPTLKSILLNTKFPLTESVLSGMGATLASINGGNATLTEVGSKSSTGGIDPANFGTAVFLLTVPGVGLPADANLPSDATVITLSNGAMAWLSAGGLNYAGVGVWNYQPATGGFYFGTFTQGYQTPASAVPTSGSATYLSDGAGNGRVFGEVWAPDGTGRIIVASLKGQGSVGVNFASGAVTGSLTNMTATASANDGGLTTPWNNVTLTGTLSGASLSGNTSAGATPSGAGVYGVSVAAAGKFTGALYGPNGQELGAVWTLNDGGPTNGKTAVGTISATKQ
jgi:hypothetical protein